MSSLQGGPDGGKERWPGYSWAREGAYPQGQVDQDEFQEAQQARGSATPAWVNPADGRPAQPDGVLIPLEELQRMLGAAWYAGYTQGQGARRANSAPPPTPMHNAGAPPHPGVVVSPPDPSWLPLLHKHGEQPCHRPAMYVTCRPLRTDKADLAILRIYQADPPTWRQPTPQDRPTCLGCGHSVNPYTQDDLDWTTIFAVPTQTASTPQAPIDLTAS
jgi:hypothetical protein